jgi:hypothetical protein
LGEIFIRQIQPPLKIPSNESNGVPKQLDEKLSPPSCVLILNSVSGVGKFAIAKFLEAELGTIPYCLIDNFILIEHVKAIEPGRKCRSLCLAEEV